MENYGRRAVLRLVRLIPIACVASALGCSGGGSGPTDGSRDGVLRDGVVDSVRDRAANEAAAAADGSASDPPDATETNEDGADVGARADAIDANRADTPVADDVGRDLRPPQDMPIDSGGLAGETPVEAVDASVSLDSSSTERPDADPADAAPDVTDAGQDLAPPQDASSGGDSACPSSDGAGWKLLGGGLKVTASASPGSPALALLDGEQPVVAWQEDTIVHTRMWQDDGCSGSWAQMGVQLGGGSPAFAFSAAGGLLRAAVAGTAYIAVERWNGSSFAPVGSYLGDASQRPGYPALASDATGNPVVAWVVYGPVASSHIEVARWSGSQWISLTAPGGVPGSHVFSLAHPVSITLGPGDVPMIAWATHGHATVVARFVSGTDWVNVGTPPPSTYGAGEANGPIVRTNSAGETYLASMNWLPAPSGYHVTGAQLVGNTWQPLGGPLVTSGQTIDFDVAVDTGGAMVIADVEGFERGSRIYTYRWTGSVWQAPTPPIAAAPPVSYVYQPRIQQDRRGRWVLAWGETKNNERHLFVARHQP
jgi:hypothetical protein